ncbi:MAG: ABC transporter permease [Candidatus Kapaibacteriales bacterium]
MSSNSKFWTIAKHEYMTRVRSKGFIISTILVPIFILVIAVLPSILAIISTEQTEMKTYILDKTSLGIGKAIVSNSPDKFFLTNEDTASLNRKIIAGDIDAYVYLDDKIFQTYKIPVYTKGGGGFGFMELIDNVVGKEVYKNYLKKSGLDSKTFELIEKDFEIQTMKVTKDGLERDYSTFSSILGYIMAFFVYIMLASYGSTVMRGVIEEKSNRIIEILVSSTKPTDILFGKVTGIGAVGLTQILIWVVLGVVIVFSLPGILSLIQYPGSVEIANLSNEEVQKFKNFEIPPIDSWLIITFILYFLLGYFLFSTLYAGIGSAVDREEDAQYLSIPILIPLILPILLSSYVLNNPDGIFSVILSIFPFFSPILMTIRIASTSIPLWQLLLSFALMILTFWFAIWISSKIYRVGILIYGKKPNFREIWRWYRQA